MGGIFKAYDIRGIYSDTLTDAIATQIGRAFVDFLQCKRVVIGRDMRTHSSALFTALARGVTMQGADVIDIGLVSTPMCYYANGSLGADASIMITASHNPGEWNGMKMCREGAIPISGPTGIETLEKMVTANTLASPAQRPGSISEYEIADSYYQHIRSLAALQRPLRLAVDYANAVGIIEGKILRDLFDTTALFDTLDGSFPNHEANPLDHETLVPLQHLVRTQGPFDFGIAFDGDADRVGFVDETGAIVPMDLITALIAQTLLKQQRGRIFYDLRSSKAVREAIEESGGVAMMSRVGHAFIKRQMRDADALFAGELSGHYYFRENYFTESSALAVVLIANLVSSGTKTLSELIAPLRRYSASGEINSTVADVPAVFHRLRAAYPTAKVTELDGLTLEFDTWWFNVRASNTEPLVRLNLEANRAPEMQARRDEVLALIRA
jgi:phosphomannomutase